MKHTCGNTKFVITLLSVQNCWLVRTLSVALYCHKNGFRNWVSIYCLNLSPSIFWLQYFDAGAVRWLIVSTCSELFLEHKWIFRPEFLVVLVKLMIMCFVILASRKILSANSVWGIRYLAGTKKPGQLTSINWSLRLMDNWECSQFCKFGTSSSSVGPFH